MAGGDPLTQTPLHVKSTYRIRLKSALLCSPGGQEQRLARKNSQLSKEGSEINVETLVTIVVRNSAVVLSLFHPVVKAFFLFFFKNNRFYFSYSIFLCEADR